MTLRRRGRFVGLYNIKNCTADPGGCAGRGYTVERWPLETEGAMARMAAAQDDWQGVSHSFYPLTL